MWCRISEGRSGLIRPPPSTYDIEFSLGGGWDEGWWMVRAQLHRGRGWVDEMLEKEWLWLLLES